MNTNPRTQSIVKVSLVHQHKDGAIHALSSNGTTRYVVRLGDAPSCTCPAGQHGRRCYHVATAEARFGAFYPAPWAVIVAETDPEPPTPTAPAVTHSGNCLLFSDPDCAGCSTQRAA